MAPIKTLLYKDNFDKSRYSSSLSAVLHDFDFFGDFLMSEIAISEIIRLKPEVIILDIELPGVLGIECTRKIKEGFPEVQILVYTVYEDEDNLFGFLSAGASGYLLKKPSTDLLKEAVVEVMKGGSPMSPCIARKVIQYFHPNRNNTKYRLCDRELRILKLLAKGLPTKIISGEVFLSEDGVKKNLKNI